MDVNRLHIHTNVKRSREMRYMFKIFNFEIQLSENLKMLQEKCINSQNNIKQQHQDSLFANILKAILIRHPTNFPGLCHTNNN